MGTPLDEQTSKEEEIVPYVQQMIETNPSGPAVDGGALVECIGACFDCAQACIACADACMGEGDLQMLARCIRLDLDCAEVCNATGKILSRQTAFDEEMARVVVEACARACRVCGEECEQHAEHGMEHCGVCAGACRRCESACDNLLRVMVGG